MADKDPLLDRVRAEHARLRQQRDAHDPPLLTRPMDWPAMDDDVREAQHLHTMLSVVLLRQLSVSNRAECLAMLRDALDRIEQEWRGG